MAISRIVWAVLSLHIAIGCTEVRTDPPSAQWSVTDVQPSVRTISFSRSQTESAATLSLDFSQERPAMVGPVGDNSNMYPVDAAQFLAGGGVAVQFGDWKNLAFFDSLGIESAPRFHHDAYYSDRAIVTGGDTVYLPVGRAVRSGNDFILRFADGRLIDSIPSSRRNLRGVTSDGLLVYWQVSSRREKNQSGAPPASPDAFVVVVAPGQNGLDVRAEIRSLLEEQPDAQLPSPRVTRNAVANGTLWLSPTGNRSLIRVGKSGLPDLYVRWNSDSTDDRADAIDRMSGGHDGSIWVRDHRAFNMSSGPTVRWRGFRQSGEMIGILSIPIDLAVLELTESEALLERKSTSRLVRIPVVRPALR